MIKLTDFINLTRLNKPIGIYLLFLPCLWGILLASHGVIATKALVLTAIFFIGSIIMRSAGCIVNDIIDKDIDSLVERTKQRPIASGRVSTPSAIVIAVLLFAVGGIILLSLNHISIIIGLIAAVLVVIYPFMKRIIWCPQVFLGIIFNSGVLIGYASIAGFIATETIILYIAAIYWTLLYDTIYAYQDVVDDLTIGVKSTAVRFGNMGKYKLIKISIMFLFFLIATGILIKAGIYYYIGLIFLAIVIYYIMHTLDIHSQLNCLKNFKRNVWIGVVVAVCLLIV